MIQIKIFPLNGIEIENIGIIRLGDTRTVIEETLGSPDSSSNATQLYYDDYELRIDLNQNNRIEFIEFTHGPFPEKTKLNLYGIDPFQVGAEQLVAILTEKNQGEIDLSEANYNFSFLNISVGIWRQFTVDDIQQNITEMKDCHEYEKNKNWLLADLDKAKNFWTIGIGEKNYYQ